MPNINPGSQSDIFVATDIIPVTPSDAADLSPNVRAIRVQTGGTLRITTGVGMVRNTFIADGELLPVYAQRIHATGTTATGIEGLL